MVETGNTVVLYGGLSSYAANRTGDFLEYPTADYKIDGASGESPPAALLNKTLTWPHITAGPFIPYRSTGDGTIIYCFIR
jgi:hypothetical protein